MTQIHITDREGVAHALEAASDATLMEAIRDGGVTDLLALCGGCCSCATCHVHIDADFIGLLPAMSADEDDLLESSDHRTKYSRLSCQITLAPALDGLRARLAPED